jgi:hypothetical protein
VGAILRGASFHKGKLENTEAQSTHIATEVSTLLSFRRLAVRMAPVQRRGDDFVDEQNAIEVIDLVLSDSRRHSFQLEDDLSSFAIQSFNLDIESTFHIAVETWDAQATFLAELLAFRFDDFGIDKGGWLDPVRPHNEHPLEDAQLRRGDPDSVGEFHHPHQLIDELLCLRIQLRDFDRDLAQNRVGDLNHRPLHASLI